MESGTLIGIVVFTLAMLVGGGFLYYMLIPKRQSALRNLMGASQGFTQAGLGAPSDARRRVLEGDTQQELERIKQATRKGKKKVVVTEQERLFHAGLFTPQQKRDFQRLKILAPAITTPVFAIGFGVFLGGLFGLIGAVMGLLVGLQVPVSVLDRKIKARGEEIMYYLPLVIEQIAIGVSSSLDVGPCIQHVVKMADERDTHNVVTEMFRLVHYHVRSGASLEEALIEIGHTSGHNELKHAFMSLSQTAKHGGEISKQLQELADAVAKQRETQIEAKIKKLELEATGPVALVFLGFLVMLIMGFGLQIMKAFN